MNQHSTLKTLLLYICISVGLVVVIDAQTDRQEAQPLLVRWNPTADIIASTNGYTIDFYDPNFNLLDSIVLDDRIEFGVGFRQMEWSPDGSKLAIARHILGTRHILEVWETSSKLLLFQNDEETLNLSAPIIWKNDSSQLAIGVASGFAQSNLYVYDAQSGVRLYDIELPSPTGIEGLAWTYDGSQIVIDTGTESQIWDMRGAIPRISPLSLPRSYIGVKIVPSPFANQIAFVNPLNPNDVEILDTITGQLIGTLVGHSKPIMRIAWGYGGIITCSYDNTTRIWDAKTRKTIASVQLSPIFAPSWNEDGTYFVVADWTSVTIRDGMTGQVVNTLEILSTPS